MKQQPTREQVLDALQTNKTVQKAATALHISYPTMQKLLKRYGIVANHNAKADAPSAEEIAKQEKAINDAAEAEKRKLRREKTIEITSAVVSGAILVAMIVMNILLRNFGAVCGWVTAGVVFGALMYIFFKSKEAIHFLSEYIRYQYQIIESDQNLFSALGKEAHRIAEEVAPSLRGKYIKELAQRLDELTKVGGDA